MVPVTMAYSGF